MKEGRGKRDEGGKRKRKRKNNKTRMNKKEKEEGKDEREREREPRGNETRAAAAAAAEGRPRVPGRRGGRERARCKGRWPAGAGAKRQSIHYSRLMREEYLRRPIHHPPSAKQTHAICLLPCGYPINKGTGS